MKGTHLLLIVNTSTFAENRGPPNKFDVLYSLLPIEFHGFNSKIDVEGYQALVPGINSIFQRWYESL